MFTAQNITIASHAGALIITCMLLIGTLLDDNARERIHRCFFALLLLNLAGVLSEFAMGFLLIGGISPFSISIKLLDFFSYLAGPLQNIVFTLYLYEYLSTKTNLSRKPFYLAALFAIIFMAIIMQAQMHDLLGSFGEEFAYERGILNGMYYLAGALSVAMFFYIAMRYGGVLRKRERLSLLSYPLIVLICYAVEGIFADIWIAYLGVSVILFTIYINIHGELTYQLERKDAELANQRIATMLSQIQPHFLYNTLNTIGDLCVTDPEAAQETVFEFSDYLRANMDSLSSPSLIPFEKELSHVQTYLALEQKRFLDRLQVRYDIQAKSFHLPPLTLQPMVENAVLHGITVRQSTGTVLISTAETTEGIKITIADDGVGFHPDTLLSGEKTHLGINNVRSRLAALCGGTLTIDSVPGKGTSVTVLIPLTGVK